MPLAFWICLIRHGANLQIAAIPATSMSMCDPNFTIVGHRANSGPNQTGTDALLTLGKLCPEGMAQVVGFVAEGINDNAHTVMRDVRDAMVSYRAVIARLTLDEREKAWCPVAPVVPPTLSPPQEIPGDAYTMDELRASLAEIAPTPSPV